MKTRIFASVCHNPVTISRAADFLRRLATAVLLLTGSAELSAGTYPVEFGKIEVDLTLNPGFSTPVDAFFTSAQGFSVGGANIAFPGIYPITGRSPEAETGSYTATCPDVTAPLMLVYPFANTVPLQPLPFGEPSAPSSLGFRSGHFEMLAGTGVPAISGMRDDQCIPYWVNLRMDLAGGQKHYYALSYRSDALLPYDPNALFPDVDKRTRTENVGALHVRLYCNGSLASAGSTYQYITATLLGSTSGDPYNDNCGLPYWDLTTPGQEADAPGAPNTLQASVSYQTTPNVVDETFLVRADRQYTVTIDFYTGVDQYKDLIFGRCIMTSALVPQGQIVDVNCDIPIVYCDQGPDPCIAADGRLELVDKGTLSSKANNTPAKNIFLPCLAPTALVYQGPYGNYRLATVDPIPTYPFANFTLNTILPGSYTPGAAFYFTTASGYEYVDSPDGTSHYFDCPDPSGHLGDLLVQNPGFVTGQILLVGPPNCPLEGITVGSLTPCAAVNFWLANSFVSADGGSSPSTPPNPYSSGIARATIQGNSAGAGTWKGSYELWLAGLNQETSSWNMGGLNLFFVDPGNAANHGSLNINDRLASGVAGAPLSVVPQQNYINDHNYCMSEVTVDFVNLAGNQIANPEINITGGYGNPAPQPDPLNIDPLASYTADAKFAGTPTTFTTGNASIHFWLPAGTYSLSPSFEYNLSGSTGRSPLPPFVLTVGCKECIHVGVDPTGVGPVVKLTNGAPCIQLPTYVLQGAVYAGPGRVLTNVSYVLNGAAPVPLCSGACGTVYSLYASVGPLVPCNNTLTITGTDDLGISGSVTFTVTYDNTLPVLTCAGNKTVQCGSTWSFDPPTAFDFCCGTNVGFHLLSSNATFTSQCLTIWQGVWQATDCCSNSITCKQLVTVVDTTPPVISCATDKTVECGTSWTFDLPTACDECCTNVAVLLVSSNKISGSCPTVWQGIWRAIDCCSNIATCTQTVTVVDTTPPFILSFPTNILVCASNGCGAVPDRTSLVLVMDNCGGVHVSQSPPPGQIICSNTTLMFTVTDDCGNSTNCFSLAQLGPCCDPPPKDMVLWMTLDEATGATCYNSVGGNSGTRYQIIAGNRVASKPAAAGPVRSAAYVNSSLCFDGTNDVVIVPNSRSIAFNFGSFSLDAWVKWDGSSGTRAILDKRINGFIGTTGYSWFLQNGQPRLQLAATSTAVNPSAASVLTPNVWTHLAVTVQRNGSATVVSFYKDGSADGVQSFAGFGGNILTTAELWIGASSLGGGTQWFTGCLDEIEIFRRVLSPKEVLDLYQAHDHGKCRPSCNLPWPATIPDCSNSLTIVTEVCNDGAKDENVTITFSTLSPAETGVSGAVNWPSKGSPYFNPAALAKTIPAGHCIPITVTITKPATLASIAPFGSPQPTACFQMIVQTANGDSFRCIGRLVARMCEIPASWNSWTNVFVLSGTNPLTIPLVAYNPTNVPLTLSPQFVVLDDQMELETNLISLNGLPPGTPATNSITLPPFTLTNISVSVRFTDTQPLTPYYLVLMADLYQSGQFYALDSATLMNLNPPTAGPVLFIDSTNGQPVVNWDSINTGWSLDSILNLNGTNWIPVPSPVIPLPDGSQGVIFQPTNNTRFFRLRQ